MYKKQPNPTVKFALRAGTLRAPYLHVRHSEWLSGLTKRKLFWLVGWSGLQYKSILESPKSTNEAEAVVRSFYDAQGARLSCDVNDGALKYSRGSSIIGYFSWLLPLSEKWAYQEIQVSVSPQGAGAVVEVSYDACLYFTLIVRPNVFESEAGELGRLLRVNA